MDVYIWQCCRLCLSMQTLHPIFTLPEHCDKYTSVIYETTGAKVVMDDTLPQNICSMCITFINNSMRFRRKCAEIQGDLMNKIYKFEIDVTNSVVDDNVININHLIDDCDDYEDNITLDTFRNDALYSKNNVNTEWTNLEEKFDLDNNVNKDNKVQKKEIISSNETEDNKPTDKNGDVKKKARTRIGTKDIKDDRKKGGAKEEIKCEYCDKILTSKLSLRNHYKIHTGFDIVCEHCGKKFITRRLLLMHCRAKHGYEKTDKCSYCDYKASNAEQVKIHERLHTGEKPFVCPECGAGFHRKSSYLQHVAIHLPEKTVQCEQCPARFKSVTLMRIHASRHRAPRYEFHCGLCGGSFARRRNVARHLLRVHASLAENHIERHKIDRV